MSCNSLHSDLINRLSSTPDILGREEYFNAAVLVPLVIQEGNASLLFEKRAAHIRQGSEICFPGGHFDKSKDATLRDTALREAQEELGLDSSSIEILSQLDTIVSPRGIIVECFLCCLQLDDLGKLKLDKDEVDEVFTVPLSWFVDNPPDIYHTRVEIQSSYRDREGKEHVLLPVEELGLPPRYKKNRSEWKKRVVVYRKNSHIIWGLTASIVHNLIAKAYPRENCTR